jgi:small subunit ribosomal protein S20
MASHASAIKKNRQDQKRRLRNRMHAGKLRTQVKKVRKALDAGDAAAAAALMRETVTLVDRTAATASSTRTRRPGRSRAWRRRSRRLRPSSL